MNWLEAVVLGIVQGLTEFLPISSSAHQLLVGRVFFDNDGGGAAFTAINQLGTETAVLVYFWKDIVRIIKAWFGSLRGHVAKDDPDARMGWLVIIGTIPIGVLGFLFQDVIRDTFRNLWLVAIVLIVFGLLLDVHQASLLGQHALAYSLLSFSVQDGHDHDATVDELKRMLAGYLLLEESTGS